MMPPAPALFSTTTVWPSSLLILSLSRRAAMSVVPPGAAGTTIVICFSGHSAKAANGMQRAMAAAASDAEVFFMIVSLEIEAGLRSQVQGCAVKCKHRIQRIQHSGVAISRRASFDKRQLGL